MLTRAPPKTIGGLACWHKSVFHLVSVEQLTLYLMTFQVFSVSSLVSGGPPFPLTPSCVESLDTWNSWRVTSSYFHSKQPLQRHSLLLLHLWTVASFQGHHLRALLIIWQVFSKINYSQLLGCNYAGWRDSVYLLQRHFQAQFSTYQDVNAEESSLLMHWSQLGGRNEQLTLANALWFPGRWLKLNARLKSLRAIF